MIDVRPHAEADRLPAGGQVLVDVDPDRPLADQMMARARAAGESMPSAVADFAIDAFEADALLDRLPRPMSRGERQLCALLITLAAPFERLTLVDPTAGLDARRRRAVVDLLADLGADHTISVASDDPMFDPYRR